MQLTDKSGTDEADVADRRVLGRRGVGGSRHGRRRGRTGRRWPPASGEAEDEAGESERDRTLSRTVDQIREKFGRDAVRPGRLLDDEEL